MFVNSLPNYKILNRSKLKASANDMANLTEKFRFGLGRVQNIVGKGENAGYQHFLLFPTMFSKGAYSRVIKIRDCEVKSKIIGNFVLQTYTFWLPLHRTLLI